MFIIYYRSYFSLTVGQVEDGSTWLRTRGSLQLLLINKTPLFFTIRRRAALWNSNWSSLRYVIPVKIMYMPLR